MKRTNNYKFLVGALLIVFSTLVKLTAQAQIEYKITEQFKQQFGGSNEITEIEIPNTEINAPYSGPIIVNKASEQFKSYLSDLLLLTNRERVSVWTYDVNNDNLNLNLIYTNGFQRISSRSVQECPVWIWSENIIPYVGVSW
jgi:hypothetical protein